MSRRRSTGQGAGGQGAERAAGGAPARAARTPRGGRAAKAARRVLLGVVLAALLLTAAGAYGAAAAHAAKPHLTSAEKAFLAQLDGDYAWDVMLKQVYGWGIPNFDPWFNQTVGGTAASQATIDALVAEMKAIGLEPGCAGGLYTEGFPIDGWEDLGSSATVVSPYHWTISPSHQVY